VIGDTLHLVITKTYKFCGEIYNVIVPNNMGDLETNFFNAKLTKLAICMKHQLLEVLQPFFSFLHTYSIRK
jgi:hypothetical protein